MGKGTGSFGKRQNKSHTLRMRCDFSLSSLLLQRSSRAVCDIFLSLLRRRQQPWVREQVVLASAGTSLTHCAGAVVAAVSTFRKAGAQLVLILRHASAPTTGV
jgi:ribosomal protein L37E